MNEIVFLHIPKNAGTSIAAGLEEAVAGTDTVLHTDNHHLTPDGWIKRLGKERFDSAMKVLCVRDPYSRLISIYEHGRRHGLYPGYDFPKFVANLPTYLRRVETPAIKKQIDWVYSRLLFVLRFELLVDDWCVFLAEAGLRNVPLQIRNEGGYKKRYINYDPCENHYTNKYVMNIAANAYLEDFRFYTLVNKMGVDYESYFQK